MDTVRVRYFAGARAAAGTAEETVDLPAGATLADVVSVLGSRHGERLAKVLTAASLLLDGVATPNHAAPVAAGVTVDVLPPFAGG